MPFPDESRLVPTSLRYDAVAPFIGLTLSTFYLLEAQPSVQQYIQANPQGHRAIRALAAAIAQAGGRVRDTAPSAGLFDEHMELFTAEEIWLVDLAADVIAMLAAAGGLDADKHALVINDLRQLDKTARIYDWKSLVPTAGDGPAEFRELRAGTPRHEPSAPTPEDLILEKFAVPAQAGTPAGAPDGLVPSGLGASAVAPFIELTLATLDFMGSDAVVRQFTEADPDAHRAIRALSTAVAQAGIRVRDTAKHRDKFDEHLRMFTAEEYWTFDLAIDVIAMFATGSGLRPNTHRLIMRDLGRLDGFVHSHHWKKEVQRAGDGPAEFRELRARIPHHKPHHG